MNVKSLRETKLNGWITQAYNWFLYINNRYIKDGKLSKGDLVGFIGGSFNDEVGATYMEFKYV